MWKRGTRKESKMLREEQINKLRVRLTEGIEEAVERLQAERLEFPMPWIGPNCYAIMADAALAVLRGMTDAEMYMSKENLTPGDTLA
jgi:hypothetical protein